MGDRTIRECGRDLVDTINKNNEIIGKLNDEIQSMNEKIENFKKHVEARMFLQENLINLAIRNGFVCNKDDGSLTVAEYLTDDVCDEDSCECEKCSTCCGAEEPKFSLSDEEC